VRALSRIHVQGQLGTAYSSADLEEEGVTRAHVRAFLRVELRLVAQDAAVHGGTLSKPLSGGPALRRAARSFSIRLGDAPSGPMPLAAIGAGTPASSSSSPPKVQSSDSVLGVRCCICHDGAIGDPRGGGK
jgi:hypothetical protein